MFAVSAFACRFASLARERDDLALGQPDDGLAGADVREQVLHRPDALGVHGRVAPRARARAARCRRGPRSPAGRRPRRRRACGSRGAPDAAAARRCRRPRNAPRRYAPRQQRPASAAAPAAGPSGANDADRMPASCSTSSVAASPAQLISTRWPLWKRRSRWVRISQVAPSERSSSTARRAGRPAGSSTSTCTSPRAAQVVGAGRADEAAQQRPPAARPVRQRRRRELLAHLLREAHARHDGPAGLAHELPRQRHRVVVVPDRDVRRRPPPRRARAARSGRTRPGSGRSTSRRKCGTMTVSTMPSPTCCTSRSRWLAARVADRLARLLEQVRHVHAARVAT